MMKKFVKKIGESKFENKSRYILTPDAYGISVAGKARYILTPERFLNRRVG